MKTIKKIDLINRIANGTEPERFIDNNILWYKGKSDKEHYYGEGGKYQLNVIRLDELNDEIELFDEEDEYEPFEEDKEIEKKKIEKLDITLLEEGNNWLINPKTKCIKNIKLNSCFIDIINSNILEIQYKINELIDKINSLENKQ